MQTRTQLECDSCGMLYRLNPQQFLQVIECIWTQYVAKVCDLNIPTCAQKLTGEEEKFLLLTEIHTPVGKYKTHLLVLYSLNNAGMLGSSAEVVSK